MYDTCCIYAQDVDYFYIDWLFYPLYVLRHRSDSQMLFDLQILLSGMRAY
jgi:hypothetical protein